MKPGRELDVLIARKVIKAATGMEEWTGDGWIVPSYSTDIRCAWRAVDAIHSMISNQIDDGLRNDLSFLELAVLGHHAGVAASFDLCNPAEWWETADELPFTARGETAAHAICLASLKVVMKEVTP